MRRTLTGTVTVCILMALLAGCTESPGDHGVMGAMSATQAQAVAGPLALAWSPDAQLAMLAGLDGPNSGMQGDMLPMALPGMFNATLTDDEMDGRAPVWRFIYRSASTSDALAVSVVGNGTAWKEIIADSGPPGVVGEWSVDSTAALEVARAHMLFLDPTEGVGFVLVGDMASAFYQETMGVEDAEPQAMWYLMGQTAVPPAMAAVNAQTGEFVDPLAMMREMATEAAQREAEMAGMNYTHPDAEGDPGGEPATFELNGTYNPSEPWDAESLIFEVGGDRSRIDVTFQWEGPASFESVSYSIRESRGTQPELLDHAQDEQSAGQNRSVEVRDGYAAEPGTYHVSLGEMEVNDFEARLSYRFVVTVS